MTDSAGRHGRRRGTGAVELRVSAGLENLAVLRTLVGAVGTAFDLDLDAVADLKLAVDEACTLLVRSAAPDTALVVVVDPRTYEVVVEVSAECAGEDCDTDDVVSPGSLSWHVLSSLTDDVQTFYDGVAPGGDRHIVGIRLSTKRAGVSP